MTDSKEVKIIEALLRNATQVVEADLAYVALLDKVTAKLDFPLIGCKGATRALELQAGGQGRWASRDYQPDKLLPDRVIAGRKTVSAAADSASRAFQNNPTYPETDPETKQPLSWLGIPLVARGSAFGVVVVESHARERAFDERTQALLATMADRVASSLATARLLESLRAVNRVGQELTSGIRLRENAVLELIYQQIGPLMNTDNMYIALYDARRRMLSFPLARENGAAEQLPDREIGPADEAKGGLTEIVIRTREPLCLPNVQAWCEETGRQLPIPPIPKSWLGVPMILEDKVLGIISLRSVEYENLYGPDDQEVLQAMAGQAAVAIDNARLYYDTNQRLEALIEVGQALSSSILLQQAEILAQVHEQAGRLMDTRNMYVALYDQEKRELSFPLAFYQGAQQQWDSRPVDIADETKGGLTEVVIRTGRPLCPPDVEAEYEKRGLTPPVPPIPRSWLGVPMMSRGEAIGVIALQNDDLVNLYGPEDQEVLRSMAAQAAVAIENARLLQGAEWVGQLTALHEIGIKITSQLELDEVLGAVVDNANRILSADFSTLFPYDSARGEFGRGIRKGRLNVEPSIPSNTGLAARILEKQQPQWIKDAKSEPGVKPSFVEENQVSSFAAIPLISKGKGVGVLFVNYSETHTFSSQEQEVVRLLAAQAAAAIENARLFEDLRKAQERIVAAERRAFTNRFAGEFIHKLTGVAGTIPIRIRQIEGATKGHPASAEVIRYLHAIERDLTEVQRFANEFKSSLSGIFLGEMKSEWVDLKSFLLDLTERVMRAIPDLPEIEVVITCKPESLAARVMKRDFEKALSNVVQNAFEAMPNGGELRIECTIVLDTAHPTLVVTVKDTGTGIASRDRSRIFELFFSTKGRMGYGLFDTRTILQTMGGDIVLSPDVTRGSAFTMYVPCELKGA